MRIQTLLLTLTISLSLALAACGGAATSAPDPARVGLPVSVEGGAYTNINSTELTALLQSKDFLLVNVHIPYEGEIEQTDSFIAFEATGPQRVNEYPADKNAKIVLYCRTGRMSATVATELVKAGYTNVWNLDNGMIAWESAGYTLLMKK